MTAINPVIYADFPDPDVVRVGDCYYMISTSMHMFPGAQILRSYDLVNWEHAAYVYDRLDGTPAQRLEGDENIKLVFKLIWELLFLYDGYFYELGC